MIWSNFLTSVPASYLLPIKSVFVDVFFVVTKKSIVLNSAGFHLKDKSHVCLYDFIFVSVFVKPTP